MAPIAGFMGFSVPEMKGVPDTFCPKGIADDPIIFEKDVFFSHHEDDLHFFQQGDDLRFLQIGDEEARHIEIDGLITIAVEEVFEIFHGGCQVIAAAEAYHLMTQVGVFEGQVGGMVGAEATAGGYDRGMGVQPLYELAYHLFEDIFFVLKVAEDAFGGVDIAGVEAFPVDAVETIDLDDAGFDLFAEGVDDLPVLIIKETGSAGREE